MLVRCPQAGSYRGPSLSISNIPDPDGKIDAFLNKIGKPVGHMQGHVNIGIAGDPVPVILTFYRGGWCPYCNLELRAYQALLPEIRAAGAELVAVSPERPDHSLTTADKNELTFTVLSDVGGALAAALGIRFTLSDTVRPFYEKAGHALPERNGDGTWALPMPATFVIAQGGRIAGAFVEPDYRRRLDPTEALRALISLSPTVAL